MAGRRCCKSDFERYLHGLLLDNSYNGNSVVCWYEGTCRGWARTLGGGQGCESWWDRAAGSDLQRLALILQRHVQPRLTPHQTSWSASITTPERYVAISTCVSFWKLYIADQNQCLRLVISYLYSEFHAECPCLRSSIWGPDLIMLMSAQFPLSLLTIVIR